MGLLDDAIKDHLELKRRHGADPGEVARLEHEALGPARREPAAPDAPVADEPAHEDADDDLEDELREVPEFEPPRAPERDEPAPAPERDEPVASVDQPTRQFSLEELEDASTPPPRAPAEHEEESAPPHTDVEPDGDDVLEETPEFLQETPEHDRLWFEQKPPKDFDF